MSSIGKLVIWHPTLSKITQRLLKPPRLQVTAPYPTPPHPVLCIFQQSLSQHSPGRSDSLVSHSSIHHPRTHALTQRVLSPQLHVNSCGCLRPGLLASQWLARLSGYPTTATYLKDHTSPVSLSGTAPGASGVSPPAWTLHPGHPAAPRPDPPPHS